MALDPALQAVIKRANRRNPGSIILGSEITQQVFHRVSSGSLAFDAALGGGWVANQWAEVVGHESAGKTLFVLKTIAANQKRDPNWTVFWVATEEFVEDYAVMCGCDLSRIVIETSNVMEEVYKNLIEFLKSQAIDCVVIDSLPNLMSARNAEADFDDLQPGHEAFLTGKLFSKSRPKLKRSLTEETRPVVAIVINQWREKIAVRYGDPRTTPGGRAKNFAYFQRVELVRTEYIRSSKGKVVGQTVKADVFKNKSGVPRRQAFIDAYIGTGRGFKPGDFDEVKDIRGAAEAYGIVTTRGSWVYFGEEKWNGWDDFLEDLRENAKLSGRIRRAVLRKAGGDAVNGSRANGRGNGGSAGELHGEDAPARGVPTRTPAKRATGKRSPATKRAAGSSKAGTKATPKPRAAAK